MEYEDDGLDDEPVAPLLPADDRLWRHPSEVPAASAASSSVANRGQEPRFVTVIALTSCITMLLTLGFVALIRPFGTRVSVERIATPATPTGGVATLADVAELAEKVGPAVTQVVARHPTGESWGSGVIYRSDGLMLAAHHVVHGSDAVRVVLADGREVKADLVGSDPDTDIALLDLEGSDFSTAPLGTMGSVKVGQTAITIGAPGGSTGGGPVVRVGVVSALGQEAGANGQKLVDMMQIDSAVAPGCSGAAVVDSRGIVIAIASTNVTTDAGVAGYATPIDVARTVAAQLMNDGRVNRGWLGIEGETLVSSRAKELGVSGGAVVMKVKPSSPAQAAGLAAADVITAVDDTAVASMSALVVRLRSSRPGETVTLTVLRKGEARATKVTLAEKPG